MARKLLVTALVAVLVNERGPGCAVFRPLHELAEASALVVGNAVPGVPQIVEVDASASGLRTADP